MKYLDPIFVLVWICRVKYDTFDILTDDEVRQGLKTYSNWPTFPQLYVKGELIGGLDIVNVSFNLSDIVAGPSILLLNEDMNNQS